MDNFDYADGKLVYVTFPVTGDREIDLQAIMNTCRYVHTQTEAIPFSPMMLPLMYLDLTKDDEQEKFLEFLQEFFERGTFDELWITGDYLDTRMEEEIAMALGMGIKIVCLNPMLEEEVNILTDTLSLNR